MSVGKVTTYQMTEEERLAYIAKHPIVRTAKTKGASFADIHTYVGRKKSIDESKKPQPKIMDCVDTNELHKRFMTGEKLEDIAKALNISLATLSNYIKEQRKAEPEKWPRRVERRR